MEIEQINKTLNNLCHILNNLCHIENLRDSTTNTALFQVMELKKMVERLQEEVTLLREDISIFLPESDEE